MKNKVILFLLLGMGFLLVNGCGSSRLLVDADRKIDSLNNVVSNMKITRRDSSYDPNRDKKDVPHRFAVLSLRPDSQKVETDENTCFFILSGNGLYVTIHRDLFNKIKGWLPEVITNEKNCVLLDGTPIDPFTLITKKELAKNQALEKLLQINNYKVYSIFSFGNYPNGITTETLQQIINPISGSPRTNQTQNSNDSSASPSSSSSNTGTTRKTYKP